jgi:hypothetical protein
VYRGSALSDLVGRYVFADYSAQRQTPNGLELAGTLLVAEPGPGETWPRRPLVIAGEGLDEYVTGIGEDADGELYVMVRSQQAPADSAGRVLKLVPPG